MGAKAAMATKSYLVYLDTSAYVGLEARLAWEFTSNNVAGNGLVTFEDLYHNGSADFIDTQGGPAIWDQPDPSTIADEAFFNQMILNFESLGTVIRFRITSVTSSGAQNEAGLWDQLSCFLLGGTGGYLVRTADPLGTNALFAITVTGSGISDSASCPIEVFAPVTFRPPDSLVFISAGLTDVNPTPELPVSEPFGFLGIDVVSNAPSVRFEYAIGNPGGRASLRLFDSSGRLVHEITRDYSGASREVVRWPAVNRRGHRVSSGVYFARLEWAGKVASRKFLIVR
jgi:hypothetical protein